MKKYLDDLLINTNDGNTISVIANFDSGALETQEPEVEEREIPILPLRNMMLFPGTLLPVNIARDSAKKLLEDAQRSKEGIGVFSQLDENVEHPTGDDLYRVGVLGRVVKLLKLPYERTARKYPRQQQALENYMQKLITYEKAPDDNPDHAANLTGTMLSEVFLEKEDEWQETLRSLFFFLVKFIYLTDAYADIFDDIRSGSYNPYHTVYTRADFDDYVQRHLESVMTECARSFEMLPLFKYREILRNILYSGVWTSYSTVRHERINKSEKI